MVIIVVVPTMVKMIGMVVMEVVVMVMTMSKSMRMIV